MTDFQTEMNRLVSDFVSQITGLARRAAIDTLETALGATNGSTRRTRAARGGAKRSPDELERLCAQFVSFVTKHPGLRIEQINKELGTATRDLQLPIRKLIADGVVKTKGKKRSTTYYTK
jgi:hypothetical protein